MIDPSRPSFAHLPVMRAEILEGLAPKDGEIFVDGTFGGGGYSRAILEAADCRLIAVDRDPAAGLRAAVFEETFGTRFQLLAGRFGELLTLLERIRIDHIDGLVLDIGVSSFQLDDGTRGFSFQTDGPLDMRMSGEGETAADVVNSYGEQDLANILYKYGDEQKSRRIAAKLVQLRADAPFTRTLQLAEAVVSVLGMPRSKPGKKPIHPATKTFQALRIHVNDELGELERVLVAAERCLKPGGRLVVVSFHSLEDRIVKNFLTERGGRAPAGSRHRPAAVDTRQPTFDLIRKSALKPTRQEADENPRARSARLRAAVRTEAPAWEVAA